MYELFQSNSLNFTPFMGPHFGPQVGGYEENNGKSGFGILKKY